MYEYISREALMDMLLEQQKKSNNFDAIGKIIDIRRIAAKIPAADVVKVVRCEKCVHKVDYKGRVMCGRRAIKYDGGWCGLKATDNDHFCSYGSRKDGEQA